MFTISDLSQTSFRSRSRPTYVVPKKDQIRQRKLSGLLFTFQILFSTFFINEKLTILGTYSNRRALSPMINDRVREYLTKADEKIEDVLERIVQNVHDSAENAQVL